MQRFFDKTLGCLAVTKLPPFYNVPIAKEDKDTYKVCVPKYAASTRQRPLR
jgi:hypothetical protein